MTRIIATKIFSLWFPVQPTHFTFPNPQGLTFIQKNASKSKEELHKT